MANRLTLGVMVMVTVALAVGVAAAGGELGMGAWAALVATWLIALVLFGAAVLDSAAAGNFTTFAMSHLIRFAVFLTMDLAARDHDDDELVLLAGLRQPDYAAMGVGPVVADVQPAIVPVEGDRRVEVFAMQGDMG